MSLNGSTTDLGYGYIEILAIFGTLCINRRHEKFPSAIDSWHKHKSACQSSELVNEKKCQTIG